MFFVYIIQSLKFENQVYVGFTKDLEARIVCHNAGRSKHTSKYRPWKLLMSMNFANEKKAMAFEKYLKTQSGRAFARKRLW